MSSTSIETNVPTAAELIARAQHMRELLKAESPQQEIEKKIAPKVAQQLRENGFFKICQSKENGGYGMRPSVLWEVAREVGCGDGSAAWVLSLTGLHPWLAGMFPPQAQDDVFANGKDAVIIALTGNVGRGVDVEFNGQEFILNGKWTYASGVDIADWACVLVETKVNEQKKLHLLLVPASSFEIDDSSWEVLGMRGTGSKDVYLTNERVPLYRSVAWDDIHSVNYPGRARNKSPMYNIPHSSYFALSVSAAIISVSFGLHNTYQEALSRRMPANSTVPQREDSFSLAKLGKATTLLEMAYQQLLQVVDDIYDLAESGHQFTETDRAKYRSYAAMLSEITLEATDLMVRNLGGGLLPKGPIERYFRDIYSMASHFLMQPDQANELFGRKILGLSLPVGARV